MYQSALDKLIDNRKVHGAAVAVCRLTSSERAVAMTSFGPDGGVVSTASDMLLFLRAFFSDKLAPSVDLAELTREWNKIWFPFTYGIGIMRFRLPRIFSPFRAQPELIGHSGLSGAFAFYAPSKGTFITGTVNQLAYPDTSFRLTLKMLGDE